MAGSNPGFDSLAGQGCLSADDVLAHLARSLEGTRLQDVHEHLDGCGACRVVMAEAARMASGAPPVRTPRTLDDGEILAGRYEIRRFIARGGMGEVYEAFDAALGETIALKTILVTAVDQVEAVKRLLAEVRIARKVTHPNVCRILEFGTHQRAGSTDDPVPFLTMPLLTGETLARRIERSGRLPPSEALRVLRELASGLEAVHEVGVVHRDFKSDNVFLVRGDDGNERAVVMDFGLARALEHGDRNKTTGRVLIGTPAYMAPEQVEGKTITKAVDVYAFGVVAFELLTGHVPFVAETSAAVALARLQRGPSPPSSIVADLDRTWDAIIQRCLRRSPQQRYGSMTDLMGALDLLRAGRLRRSWRPATAAMAVAAVAVATAGIVVRRPRPKSASPRVTFAADLATPATTANVAPEDGSPALSQQAVPRSEAVPTEPVRAIRHAPSARRARPSAAQAVLPASASPAHAEPSSARPVEGANPSVSPFDRPAAPRARQADDLVDPF